MFEAFKRREGDWTIRYQFPLSCLQAFAITCSVLHNPATRALDALPPPRPRHAYNLGTDLEREIHQLAAEAIGAVRRGGELGRAHAILYAPYAEALLSQLVSSALSLGAAGSAEAFTAGLSEALQKVGLYDQGRLERCLHWAAAKGVSSLASMQSLLQVDGSEWKQLLKALAPTKSFHKLRLQTQLKRLTEGEARAAPRSTTDVYWALIDEALGVVCQGLPIDEDGGGGSGGGALAGRSGSGDNDGDHGGGDDVAAAEWHEPRLQPKGERADCAATEDWRWWAAMAA